ncbi:malonyl-coenzyme A:anthocyanin 3-O-glucoside-6''-O-malonyltransferase-like protein [Tanacetum coccineum]
MIKRYVPRKLFIYPNPKKPEIRYVEDDSIAVTFAESNQDFDYLIGNHPRDCDKFYHLIPLLGQPEKTSDFTKIPIFAVQETPGYQSLDLESDIDVFADGVPTSMIGVAGTPKLKFYDIDFGWGKPKKVETVSIDCNGSISMNACKESNDDLEIGVCLPADEMKTFVRSFENGLQAFV